MTQDPSHLAQKQDGAESRLSRCMRIPDWGSGLQLDLSRGEKNFNCPAFFCDFRDLIEQENSITGTIGESGSFESQV
jgi:hypothetical protein